jgi:hypothetical protein
VVKVAGVIVVGLLVALAIAWFASEQSYDNCIQKAEAAHPIPSGRADPSTDTLFPEEVAKDAREARRRAIVRRRAELDDCSRLPF